MHSPYNPVTYHIDPQASVHQQVFPGKFLHTCFRCVSDVVDRIHSRRRKQIAVAVVSFLWVFLHVHCKFFLQVHWLLAPTDLVSSGSDIEKDSENLAKIFLVPPAGCLQETPRLLHLPINS